MCRSRWVCRACVVLKLHKGPFRALRIKCQKKKKKTKVRVRLCDSAYLYFVSMHHTYYRFNSKYSSIVLILVLSVNDLTLLPGNVCETYWTSSKQCRRRSDLAFWSLSVLIYMVHAVDRLFLFDMTSLITVLPCIIISRLYSSTRKRKIQLFTSRRNTLHV